MSYFDLVSEAFAVSQDGPTRAEPLHSCPLDCVFMLALSTAQRPRQTHPEVGFGFEGYVVSGELCVTVPCTVDAPDDLFWRRLLLGKICGRGRQLFADWRTPVICMEIRAQAFRVAP